PGLKVLLTKDSQSSIILPIPTSARNMILPVLSLSESLQVLHAIGINPPDDEQLHRTCMGRPDRLETVRRLVRSGVAPNDLVRDIANKVPSLFDIEWSRMVVPDAACDLALAIIAFDDSDHSVSDLCRLVGYEDNDLRQWLATLTFVECAPDGAHVAF